MIQKTKIARRQKDAAPSSSLTYYYSIIRHLLFLGDFRPYIHGRRHLPRCRAGCNPSSTVEASLLE